MFEIRLGKSAILIAAIIATGYIIIFISVLMQSSNNFDPSDMSSFTRIQAELTNAKKQTYMMEKELTAITKKLKETEFKALASDTVKREVIAAYSSDKQMTASRPGVIILGMHRSGTSIVGGLMNKMGLKTGGPLIQPANDNAKGFFERLDVVLQNDFLMKKQVVHYAFNTNKYDTKQGLKDILTEPEGSNFFNEGRRGLVFLNDPNNYPWMLKDPRLCITMRTWLPLLNFIPAILFIYRHPFDVGLSMNKRETEHFPIAKALKLWYIYNKKAITKSHDLCRVIASHRVIMSSPQNEFDRVFNELNNCGVNIPGKLDIKDINDFIDIKLQHGRNGLLDTSCDKDTSTLLPPVAWPTTDVGHIKLYRETMRVFCALEDKSAFEIGFKWDESISDN